jgi:ferric-dicitrate binding protein FerR (iron transport regulator)
MVEATRASAWRVRMQSAAIDEDVPDFVDFRRRSGDHQAALLV